LSREAAGVDLWMSRHMVLEPYWIEKDRLRDAIEIAGRRIRPHIESL
jgi:hypothetical protein